MELFSRAAEIQVFRWALWFRIGWIAVGIGFGTRNDECGGVEFQAEVEFFGRLP